MTQPGKIREYDVELATRPRRQRGVGAAGELVEAEQTLPDSRFENADNMLAFRVRDTQLPWPDPTARVGRVVTLWFAHTVSVGRDRRVGIGEKP